MLFFTMLTMLFRMKIVRFTCLHSKTMNKNGEEKGVQISWFAHQLAYTTAIFKQNEGHRNCLTPWLVLGRHFQDTATGEDCWWQKQPLIWLLALRLLWNQTAEQEQLETRHTGKRSWFPDQCQQVCIGRLRGAEEIRSLCSRGTSFQRIQPEDVVAPWLHHCG